MSAFGCFKKEEVRGSDVKVEGKDPDVHMNLKDKQLGPYGCQGHWQSKTGQFHALVHDKKYEATADAKPVPADVV